MIKSEIKKQALSLAEKYPTPFYLIDLDAIKEKFCQFKSCWQKAFPNFRLAYSYKTNSLKAITQLFANNGGAAEVVSWTEGQWALEDGFQSNNIFFDGPLKNKTELEPALHCGANIQIDSFDELDTIINLVRDKPVSPSLSLRLSTNYHTLGKSRFGFLVAEFKRAWEILHANKLNLRGLHLHVGSNINDPEVYVNALREYAPIIRRAHEAASQNHLFWLDIGGGYPAASLSSDLSLTPITKFVQYVESWCRSELRILPSELELITEPGRHLVEDHGFLVASILVQKQREDRTILVADAGTNLVRSISAWHHPIELLHETDFSHEQNVYELYGSNCFERDVLCKDWKIAHHFIKVGSKIIIGSAGGYDIPSTNGWTRPLPPVFGIHNEKIFKIRKEQTLGEVRALQQGWDALTEIEEVKE